MENATGNDSVDGKAGGFLGRAREAYCRGKKFVAEKLKPVTDFLSRNRWVKRVLIAFLLYLVFFSYIGWLVSAAPVLCLFVIGMCLFDLVEALLDSAHPRLRWWSVAVSILLMLCAISLSGAASRDFGQFEGFMQGRMGINKDIFVPVLLLDIMFNLGALAGAAALAFIRANPFHWVAKRRLMWGAFALFFLIGRLAIGFCRPLLLAIGQAAAASKPIEHGMLTSMMLYRAAPLAALLLAGFVVVFVLCVIVSMSIAFLFGPLVFLCNQLFDMDRSLTIYRHKRSRIIGYIVKFAYWLIGETPEATPDDSKGARFATPREAAAMRAPQEEAAFAFGHMHGAPFFLRTEKHVLVMASTRSGKGVSLIVPHLLRYPGSAFVLDPKGENARATLRQRQTLNNQVLVLDPFGITGLPQARFNPLSRFTPENMEAESKSLAAALVLGERDHWTASAQQLIAAIILYVVASPDFGPEAKDLGSVRKLLLGGVHGALKEMSNCDLADGLIADLAASFLNTPDNERGSIISTAQRETEILDNPFVLKCLAASGEGEHVDFSAWRNGTMTLYLCLSAPKFPVFSRWLRLVLTSALDDMTNVLSPPALPVCFMLDELATLGHLDSVENAIGLAAGYGVQLVTVFQDVAQMKDLYKSRWASFIGNAGVRALFNLDDYDTAHYWSQFMGGHLVQTQNIQQDIYGMTHGQSVGEAMRPLLSPEEIMLTFAGRQRGAGAAKMLVLAQGAHPVVTERVAYFDDQGLDGLWDDPR